MGEEKTDNQQESAELDGGRSVLSRLLNPTIGLLMAILAGIVLSYINLAIDLSNLSGRVESLESKIDTLDSRIYDLTTNVSRTEGQLSSLSLIIEILKSKLESP